MAADPTSRQSGQTGSCAKSLTRRAQTIIRRRAWGLARARAEEFAAEIFWQILVDLQTGKITMDQIPIWELRQNNEGVNHGG